MADREQMPMPALCPRIRLRITDSPMSDDQRIAGEGSLDQIRTDLDGLQELGCTHVLLDTYYDVVEATTHHETAWRMLATIAEKTVDLRNETVR